MLVGRASPRAAAKPVFSHYPGFASGVTPSNPRRTGEFVLVASDVKLRNTNPRIAMPRKPSSSKNVQRRLARTLAPSPAGINAMILGVGSFAHSIGAALRDADATVSTYFTRNYGFFPPSLVGKTFSREAHPSPVPLLRENKIDVVLPQSIDWATQPWAQDLLKSGVGIFSPVGEAMRIERERDFARELCAKFEVPFPKSFVASNRIEAEKILQKNPQPFVIKN